MPHTLLLADDSVTIQRVIELTFADEDVKVVAVSDGDQAIARLDAAPPDIVLADVGMPGKNGYEVAQYIKQSPHLSHIPVVLLTGAFEPVDQARAAEAGCDGVLAKPFEPQLVIGRVRELLGHGKGAETLDAALAPPPAPNASWTPPLADQPLQPPPAPPSTGELANYFDRLDAAFSNLSQPSAPAAAPPEMTPFAEAAPPAAAISEAIDWFGTPGGESQGARQDEPFAEPTLDAPLQVATATPAFEAPAVVEPPQPVHAPAPEAVHVSEPESDRSVERPDSRPSLPDKPIALPPLADAFAALLAAEQGETPSNVAWPAAAPAAATSMPNDAVIEQIAQRVLDAMAPRVDASVRSAVSDLVSQLAERLIREEIERIKASIT